MVGDGLMKSWSESYLICRETQQGLRFLNKLNWWMPREDDARLFLSQEAAQTHGFAFQTNPDFIVMTFKQIRDYWITQQVMES